MIEQDVARAFSLHVLFVSLLRVLLLLERIARTIARASCPALLWECTMEPGWDANLFGSMLFNPGCLLLCMTGCPTGRRL
jgi:hypothetical protein